MKSITMFVVKHCVILGDDMPNLDRYDRHTRGSPALPYVSSPPTPANVRGLQHEELLYTRGSSFKLSPPERPRALGYIGS